jgi:hypothetical protein
MATVQTLLHRLALRVDPRTPAGVEFTTGTIGTTAGDRFSAQRLLDIYNDARIALFQAVKTSVSKEELQLLIPGITKEAFITFTTSGTRQEYSLPSDYMDFISLRGRYLDGSYISTVLAPIVRLPSHMISVVQYVCNTHYAESGANRFVFEDTGKLVHFGGLCGNIIGHGTWSTTGTAIVGSGTTFLTELSVGAYLYSTSTTTSKAVSAVASNLAATTATFGGTVSGNSVYISDYRFYYFGLATLVITDVTGGATTESIDTRYHPALMDIGEAIAMEMGQNEVLALAKTLTGGK